MFFASCGEVSLQGACVGCSKSSITLNQGIKKMVLHYVPEVKDVIGIGKLLYFRGAVPCCNSCEFPLALGI